jgi:hypothetical protein
MRRLKIQTLYLILLIWHPSCRDEPSTAIHTIQIPNKTNNPLLVSDLANNEIKIDLETIDGSFLGPIRDVKVFRDLLFVADTKISIFDKEGNFIQLLGRKGEGPGEYKSVTSMDIHPESGQIYVSAFNKLLIYGPDLELIDERKLGYPIKYLKALNDGLWIVSEEIGIKVEDKMANQTTIYQLDTAFQILDSIPFRRIILDKKRVGGYGVRYWLSDIDEGLFMFMPVLTPENMLRDTLYQVMDNTLKPAIRFEFERGQSLDERGYQTLLLYNVVNSSSYYILEYDQDWERFMFLYDKKKNTGYNLRKGLLDDTGEPVFLRPLDLRENLFYYIKKKEYSDKSTEEKNPEIGIVKLR